MYNILPSVSELRIAVIGLGYVGLPLAVEFAKKFPVVGFDIKKDRIDELNQGHDATLEVEDSNLQSVLVKESPASGSVKGRKGLFLTTKIKDMTGFNVFIVTVPTPVDKNNRPDLTPLIRASVTVGKVIQPGGIVIYESTVYPGCTEEDCLPVVEKTSGLTFFTSSREQETPPARCFFAGYSPERINPGDKVNTVLTIKKITSGSTPEAADLIDSLYRTILLNGTHKAPSIKVAEAAKVIENSQRDINIAFMNELAKICSYFKIDTSDVLEAAGTKWNFLKFKPGLVGGHCIGIDPYYIAQKAEEAGYHPEIILSGRRMNDGMGAWIAREVIKLMIGKEIMIKGSRVLILGITFKENCPDIRNSKVIDLYHELKKFGCTVEVFDPWADPREVKHEYGIDILTPGEDKFPDHNHHDAVVLAVAHLDFLRLDFSEKNPRQVIYDIKALLPRTLVDGRL
jgi:UDP-N-acetyl-D-galactosamine dehydrogenase